MGDGPMSLVASTRGVALMQSYAKNLLPPFGSQTDSWKAMRHRQSTIAVGLQQVETLARPRAVRIAPR